MNTAQSRLALLTLPILLIEIAAVGRWLGTAAFCGDGDCSGIIAAQRLAYSLPLGGCILAYLLTRSVRLALLQLVVVVGAACAAALYLSTH